MRKSKNIGGPYETQRNVVNLWLKIMQYHMKAKQLKRLETYKIRINPTLDQYLDVPMAQDKLDAGNAILLAVGLPTEMAGRY